MSHDIIVDPYEISIVAVQTISPEDAGMPKLNDTMAAELNGGAIEKRDLTTPASIAAWPTSKISAACSQVATGTATRTATITATAPTPLATETKGFQTMVVVQSTCTAPAPRPTAPSYTKIVGGEPSEGVPMVPGPSDGRHYGEQFSLALPFPVKIFETSSTQISIAVRGYITVGPYTFNAFADELYVYGPGWNQGLFYRVDGAIGSRKIHFSWFTGSYYWGHERFHITATKGRLIHIVEFCNGKNIPFAQYWSDNVHEGQEITFDTTGAGSVSAKDFDRIDCCKKTGWEWHVCSEV